MALEKCPKCGNQISDKATTCPHCGCAPKIVLSEIREHHRLQQKKRRKRIIVSVASVFLLMAVAVIAYLYNIDALNSIPSEYRKQTEDYLEQCESAINKGDFDKGIVTLSYLRGRMLTNRQTKCFEKKRKAVIEVGLNDLENVLASVANKMDDKSMERAKEEIVTLNTLQCDASQTKRLKKAKEEYVAIQILELERKTNEYKTDPGNYDLYDAAKKIAMDLHTITLTNEQQGKVDTWVYEVEELKKQEEINRKKNPLDYLVVTPKSVGNICLGAYGRSIPSKGEFYDKVKKEKEIYEQWDLIDIHYDLYFKGEMILELFVDDNDKITSISICTPKIKLGNGIHIGMTPIELESQYKAKFIVTEGEGLWLKYVVPGYETCQLVGKCPDSWELSNGETLDYDDVGRELPARLLRGCRLEHIHLVSW